VWLTDSIGEPSDDPNPDRRDRLDAIELDRIERHVRERAETCDQLRLCPAVEVADDGSALCPPCPQ